MSRQVVLLEGGEGTGKTSLCNWLAEEHGFKIVKLPTPGSDFEKLIFNKENLPYDTRFKAIGAVMDMLLASLKVRDEDRIVFDRGILSTCAYQEPVLASESLYACDAMSIVNEITDVVVLNVSPEVGLSREAEQNEVSKAGMAFHTQVNERFDHLGKVLKTVLQYRQAERILNNVELPRAKLLRDGGSSMDKELVHDLGRKPSMFEWNWTNLQSVSVVDTEAVALNGVKLVMQDAIGLPAK